MNKTGILLVGPYSVSKENWGGVATVVHQIYDSEVNKLYRFNLIDTAKLEYKDGVNIANIKFAVKLIIKFLLKVLSMGKCIVHIHTSHYWGFWQDASLVLISKLFSKKVILHMHGAQFDNFYLKGGFLTKKLIRFVLSKPEKNIVLSKSWYQFFRHKIKIDNLILLHNAIETAETGLNHTKENGTNVMFVGSLDKRKGLYDVVPLAIKRLSAENINFIFIGQGDLEYLKSYYRRIGIYNKCQFVGSISRHSLSDFYQKADIFILPSHAEGLPMTLLETMSFGLPVIATDVGGIPEVVKNGENGFLIKPGDDEALAEYISLLSKDRELRQKMGRNNRKKIVENFSLKSYLKKIDRIYGQLVD